MPSFAQTGEAVTDSDLTLEQWQKRVETARRRLEEYMARMRARTGDASEAVARQQREEQEANDRRGMTNPTLKRDDIVSTSKGFLVFTGRDEDPSSEDFRQTEQL